MKIKITKFIKEYQNEVQSMVFDGLNDTAKNHDNNVKLAIKNYLNRSLNWDINSPCSHWIVEPPFTSSLPISTNEKRTNEYEKTCSE